MTGTRSLSGSTGFGFARSLTELEQKVIQYGRKIGENDETRRGVLAAIRQLVAPPERLPNRIGFQSELTKGGGSPKAVRVARSLRKSRPRLALESRPSHF